MWFLQLENNPIVLLFSGAAGIAILFLLVILLFLPIVIAVNKNHPQTTSITLITLFAGFTVVGWLVALMLALSNPRGSQEPRRFARRKKVSRFKRG